MTPFVPKHFDIKLNLLFTYSEQKKQNRKKLLHADQKDIIKNFAVVTSGVVKRVDCTNFDMNCECNILNVFDKTLECLSIQIYRKFSEK